MKLLVCTRCDDNIKQMSDLTHPFLTDYAERCGADFMKLSHQTDCTHMEGKWHYRILKMNELFEEYDRILHIDTDVIVTPWAPSVFDHVPEDKIGTVFEDVGTRRKARRRCIASVQAKFGDVGWTTGYINTGFVVASKCHKEVFTKIDGQYYEDWGHDDVHLGYQIRRHGKEILELDYKWNNMTMFCEGWNGSPSRFDSYVIHYAGKGSFDGLSRIEQIKADAEKVRELAEERG